MANHDPSERSPLLTNRDNPSAGTTTPTDNNDVGTVDNGLLSKQPTTDEENQQEGEVNRDAQFEGSPEVKAQLKYILPAITIGV